MRLNHLRVSGFKSFPEQAELAFDSGVTAIVGPNGCGKSNLIDAITWVLGEQSVRSLRGERMEDVIFSGSDGRRPTATAEVRLRFSEVAAVAVLDGDGAEMNGSDAGSDAGAAEPDESDDLVRDIEVGRRLFRSGESEYLIDGRVCRLRDIQDLLMDSGVGVKAYAVIEQGKIGQVLGARPMERRQLIEEAAGVTKFKSRRRAAELKIEAARQNLTRVDDIIYEIDSQRSALKRQAAKARRYRQLREDLRRWEKVQIAGTCGAVDRVIEQTGRRLDDARAREEAAAAHVAELETAHERRRIEQAEADRAATAAREAAHAHELNARKLEQQIEFEKQQVDELAESAAALAAEGEALAAQRSPLRAELAEKTEASRRCGAERQAAATKLEAAEAEHATAQAALDGLESDVEEARSAAFSAANSAAVLEHVTQSAAEACERIDADGARLAAESADLDTEAARLAAGREENAASVERLRAALDGVRAEREESEARLAAANAAHGALAADARTREQELAGVVARAVSLEELIASREGYGDAAKLLLTAPGAPFEHMGAVADHLQVDREHERVVEAGLDDLLHALVVRSERDARKALELLAEQGGGRCGFAIAEALEAEAAEAAPAAPAGASLTPFTDLVRVSGPGAAAVKALLARYWLAPSFEAAAQAARAGGGTVVAPDGTAFRGAAVIRGGGRSEQRSILRLRGELEDLQVRRASAEDAVRRVTEQQAALAAEAAGAETALKALQEDERARERELLDAEHRMARCGEDEARLAQRRELVRNEERRAREERAAAASRQDEARESIARLAQEREAAEQRRAEAQERLAAARTALQALDAQAGAARVAHAGLAERAAGLETAVRGIEAAAAELDRRVQTCTDDRQRALDRRKALQASIADAGTRVDEEVRLLDARRADVRGLDERAAGLRAEMAGQAQQVHAARQALDACRTERSGLEVDRARAEAERGQLEEACREAFQLGLDQVCAEVEQLERDGVIADDARRLAADDDAAEPAAEPPAGRADAAEAAAGAPQRAPAAAIVARLRARIERLGAVNMMAVEQFDELEQRHEFLTGQRADLLESIKSTGEAIERINTTTRDRFRQAFQAVNEHLQQTFSTLFGGGSARLVLLDEADLLESGIDIVAQPPGKRLQSVQLLSGGEKALAAMALMFAIFKYRPSPFCLLDEIDAPLDDANIGRFVEVLRGMQDETQFVLVTHNRKTMEIADRLYGVTMEEPGVSKLVSVWFN